MESNTLLVDDNPGMLQRTGRILTGLGHLRFAASGEAALRQWGDIPPDLVLLVAEMPGLSGYQVCEAMKLDAALRDVPVIFVTGHSGPEFELKGLEVGAVDFIAKPISEPLLVARVRTQLRIKHLTDELRRLATIDALAEVSNRRGFDASRTREWKRGLRCGEPIRLMTVDVDHFKLFNDRYGHPTGDACLRSVAKALRGITLRPADLVAPYGGEEFALLPQTARSGAERPVRRVLGAVEALGIPHEASPAAGHLSVSIGIGCHDNDSPRWTAPPLDSSWAGAPPFSESDLLRSADAALYRAKHAGRAQAGLDIDDADAPMLAREIVARQRTGRGQGAA